MKPGSPVLSAVMAVYNGEIYLPQTLDSILSQTFDDFELIVIDDASSDSTPAILKSYSERDSRIRVFRNESNLRLAASLNRGIGLAKGDYILRMDADDICLPTRFSAQYRYMRENPAVDLSFCKFFALRDGDITPSCLGRRLGDDSIKAMLLFFCPVLHPGVIVKSEVMKKYAYDPLHLCSEDLDLWLRMAEDGVTMTCSGEYLMLYRIHGSSVTATSHERQKNEVQQSEQRYYDVMLGGMPAWAGDFYMDGIYFRRQYDRHRLYAFYRYILKANRKRRRFSENAIVAAMEEILAEYRRTAQLSVRDRLYMLKFGGVRLVAEILQRKKQAAKDLESARVAAENAGLQQKANNGVLPIYGMENEKWTITG